MKIARLKQKATLCVSLIKNQIQQLAITSSHASSKLKVEGNGSLELTEEMVEEVNRVLSESGFEGKLEVDLSPKFVMGYVQEKEKASKCR